MDPYTSIVTWLVLAMTTWNPPTETITYPQIVTKVHPDVVETSSDTKIRYESIAKDIAYVVYSKEYVPFTKGKNARANEAMYALGIASFESAGFRKDVDAGYTFGDNDQSYCMMQVWMPTYIPAIAQSKEGWFGKDVAKDRVKCFIVGTDRMRASWNMCAHANILDRFAGYTIGHCKDNEEKSRTRAGRAQYWITYHPAPVDDKSVLEYMESKNNEQ